MWGNLPADSSVIPPHPLQVGADRARDLAAALDTLRQRKGRHDQLARDLAVAKVELEAARDAAVKASTALTMATTAMSSQLFPEPGK